MDPLYLRYGARPLEFRPQPTDDVRLIQAPDVPPLSDLEGAVADALANPVGTPPLARLSEGRESVGIIIGDQYRDGPKQWLVELLLAALPHPPERVTLFLANGTHAPGPPEASGLDPGRLPGIEIINHDARDDASLEFIGVTSRGIAVQVNRRFLDCELKISLGQVKPHYFAGLAGGAKGVFPGLGGLPSIKENHLLKRLPGARLGNVGQDNPMRQDVEEAARMAGHDFILDIALNEAGQVAALVAGDVVEAHRELARRCLPWWRQRVEPSPVVVVSDGFPVTRNLYQACKLLAVAGWCLEPGGTIVLAAECPEGTGPIDAVNKRIYRDGIRHFLPPGAEVLLVSNMPKAEARRATFLESMDSIDAALDRCRTRHGGGPITVLPKGGNLIPVRSPQ